MKKFLVLTLLFSSLSFADESVTELYLDLEDSGVVIIKAEPCRIQGAIKLGISNRAVGIEGNGTTHEGCWNSPDVNEAEQVQGMKIIPIVNLYFDGVIQTVPLKWFRLPSTPDTPAPGETWI
jgi:hypothetical protein